MPTLATSVAITGASTAGTSTLDTRPRPDHAAPADRGEHRADDAADQRVRRAGRQAEQPGQQVPDDAADQAGEDQLEA